MENKFIAADVRMSNEIRLASNSLSKRQQLLIDNRTKKVAEQTDLLFKRIDDLLFNVDKLTNINHSTNHQRIMNNLLKINYRNFCFRMIKQLAMEIIEIAHRIHKQVGEESIKSWLLHIANVMKKMIWMWSKCFYGVAILEQQDVDKSKENIILFHKFSSYELKQYKRHIDTAAKEIRNMVPFCKIKENDKAQISSCQKKLLQAPVCKYERYLKKIHDRWICRLEQNAKGESNLNVNKKQHQQIFKNAQLNKDGKIDNKLQHRNIHTTKIINKSYSPPLHNPERNCKRGRSESESDSTCQIRPIAKKARLAAGNFYARTDHKMYVPSIKVSQKFCQRSQKQTTVCKTVERSLNRSQLH